MSTGAKVVGGSARLADPIEAANHYFDYLDEHQMGLHGGGSGTNPDNNTGTGTDTTPKTGNDAVVAGKAPKKKRTGRRNELDRKTKRSWHRTNCGHGDAPQEVRANGAGGCVLLLVQSTWMHP